MAERAEHNGRRTQLRPSAAGEDARRGRNVLSRPPPPLHRPAPQDADWGGARARVAGLPLDLLTVAQAVDGIAALVEAGGGGAVFHLREEQLVAAWSAAFRQACERASLCLPGGRRTLWAARLAGVHPPEKVSGPRLLPALMELAGQRRWRVFIIGGAPELMDECARRLETWHGAQISGSASPPPDAAAGPALEALVRAVTRANPHLVLVGRPTPEQELLIDALRGRVGAAVLVGMGGALEAVAGQGRRAPAWVTRLRLERFYRLAREPGRLWRTHLPYLLLALRIFWSARVRRRLGRAG